MLSNRTEAEKARVDFAKTSNIKNNLYRTRHLQVAQRSAQLLYISAIKPDNIV